MSSQAEARQDAVKKRREYVRKKLRVCLLAGCFVVVALSLVFWTVSILLSKAYDFQHPYSEPAWYSFELYWNRYLDRYPEGLATTAGRVALLIVTALQCCVLYRRKAKEAAGIPYVPPVAEQLATLPAEAILLRHSSQPSTAPEELLRAAREGAKTEAGELMRAETRPMR